MHSMDSQRAPGWLFLRRCPGERLAIFDRRCLVWLKVIDVDLDTETARIALTGHQPLKLALGEDVGILQGDGQLRIGAVVEPAQGAPFVSLGIKVPREILVRREELIKGMSDDDLKNLAA